MSEQKTKPTFELLHNAIIPIELNGVVYNAGAVGPYNWHKLRAAEYGEGFRQGTFGENFTLAHCGYVNKDSENKQTRKNARNVVKVVRKHWLAGNTALYGGDEDSELIFVQDFPEVKEDKIVMNQKDLEERLGSHELKGVIFSDDGLVRAIPRANVRQGECNAEQVLQTTYPIFLTGDEEAPEKVIEMMETINKPGYFWVPAKRNVRVPGLVGIGDSLFLGDWNEFSGIRYSFGVRQ